MNQILKTKSGNEVFVNESGQFFVKGDVKTLVQELEKDRQDKSLPHDIHNTCVITLTMLVTGNYQMCA